MNECLTETFKKMLDLYPKIEFEKYLDERKFREMKK